MPKGVYKRKPKTPAQLAADEAKRGVPLPQETCAKMSDAMTGVPNTPEHNAAISSAKTGIPLPPEHIAALKNHWENMRSGNDICDHHYIYDHDDLSKHTIKMTRSDHQKLHLLLRRLGYIVPHINQ